MANIVVIGMLLLSLGGAVGYLLKQKKKGSKCASCPYAARCFGGCKEHDCSKND